MSNFKDWWHDFWDLLFPRCCAGCGQHLGRYEQQLCASCLMALPYVKKPQGGYKPQLRCYENETESLPPTKTEGDFYANEMAGLFWGKIPIERAFSYVQYSPEGLAHRVLMALKYGHWPDLGVFFGRMMARDLLPKGFFQDVDCIVPLPLHWKRHMARGYNQSAQLAKGIAEMTGLPIAKGYVRRVRNNETQTHKTAAERLKNVEGVFRLRRPIPYHHILLVDDVLTTSATLTSCAQAIHKQQPDVVFSVLTLARA